MRGIHIANGYLVIPGQALVRVGAVLAVVSQSHNVYQRRPAVEIRHGGKGFSSPVININCESYAEAEELQVEIQTVLTQVRTLDLRHQDTAI